MHILQRKAQGLLKEMGSLSKRSLQNFLGAQP